MNTMRNLLTSLILFYAVAFAAFAQQSSDADAPVQVDESPLKELGNRYYNSIKLLQNRFRIDYKVEEITMVFFRNFGSTPVVLVRPDGSKLFNHMADGWDIDWYDAPTFDMIHIRNPMPGPWQAVGQILPNSRVMVISDIQLETKPLPAIIFSGEILKQTAYLTNGGEPIDYNEFRDVVTLSMEFSSTNNPNYNNFGAANETIANFEDNGKGMDERPLDGTFTGQFNLRIASGEWKPIFTVKTPMFTRERIGENIRLLPNPVTIEVELDDETDGEEVGYHILKVDADREKVDIRSLLIDGKIRFPNGDVQNFSITEVSNDIRTHDIVNYEYGVFRVKLTAYGNTIDGRDFILDVPEYTFVAEEPILETEMEELAALPDDALSAEALAMQELEMMNAEADRVEAEMTRKDIMGMIITINVLVLLLVIVVLAFLQLKKRGMLDSIIPNNLIEQIKETITGMIGKKGDAKAKPAKKAKKGADEDDAGIIDLSMPD